MERWRKAAICGMAAALVLGACSGRGHDTASESSQDVATAESRRSDPPFHVLILDPRVPDAALALPRSGPLTDPVFLWRGLSEGKAPRGERLAALLAEAAADPRIRAVVVCPAVSGTAEAFRKAKAARPDLVLLAGEPEEEALSIQASSDLVLGTGGRLEAWLGAMTANRLGATALVRIGEAVTPDSRAGRRHAAEKDFALELGLDYELIVIPADALSRGAGAPSRPDRARTFVETAVATALAVRGQRVAFVLDDESLAASLVTLLSGRGGLYVGGPASAPGRAFPEVFGLAASPAPSLGAIEGAIAKAGCAGRFAAWFQPAHESFQAGLALLARRTLEESAKLERLADLKAALGAVAPGAYWRVEYLVDAASGVRAGNYILAYPDAYVFGRGYLSLNKLEPPARALSGE